MARSPEGFESVRREAECIVRELDLPPCPAILARFNEEFNAPRPDLRRLAALIATDIGLSAALIKTVNSAFYGLATKVTGIEQALSVLGLRASANLVSSLLLRHAFPDISGPAAEQFWDRSTRIATLAGAIAARIGNINRDEARTYVLFRDCGMLVMLRKFPQYADLMAQSAKITGAQFMRIEDACFRFNHARVACALARNWSLPEPLCAAIFCHHDIGAMPPRPSADAPPDSGLIAFGLLAEQIVALHLNQGLCPDWPGAERSVLDALDLQPEGIVALAEDLQGAAAWPCGIPPAARAAPVQVPREL